MTTGERTQTMRWLPGFVALSAIWGSSFALIKIAVDADVPPLRVALWRCVLGALALLAVCLLRRTPFPRDPATWGHAAVVGALLNAAPFALFAYGEQHVSSVLAGVVNAATPLMTFVFVLVLAPRERATPVRLPGLLVGFLGVLCVLGGGRAASGGTLAGGLACLAATACYGAGFAYTRRFFSGRGGSATALTGLQLGWATVELALVSSFADGVPGWPGAPAAAALALLGVVGTGYAFILNFRVIRTAGPTVASTVTYVVPLWSTALGAVLLGEPVGWTTVVGGALVVAGVLLTRARVRPNLACRSACRE
jgi:drug/metabolite transporter (DMT)-like permease